MKKIRAVVIDDEYESRHTLINFLVKYCPDITVVAEAASVTEAVGVIEESLPDLIFLDINMPAENGFQLFDRLRNKDFYTVFVTAYDAYALQAFRHHAADYLLKPIDIHELMATVTRIVRLRDDKIKVKELTDLLHAFKRPAEKPKIALPVTEGLIYVRTTDIVRCEASSNYTFIYFEDGRKIIVARTLVLYEEALKDKGFARVHHQHLINLHHVEKYVRGRGGIVVMSDQKEIQVSQRKKEEFLRLLEGQE